MAEYKVVDAEKLDADLASVADAIRTKGGTSESLTFPQGFVDAVGAIESGGGGTELFFSLQGRCYTKNLEIPEGIAMIGEFAFDKCDKLTLKNNRLPESLTTLGKQAFFSCSDMVLEKLPSNLSTIGDDSLSKTQFIGQEIPSTVKSIGNYAFANCTTINALYFKGKPNSIRENAFYYCSKIKHIYVPWAEGEVANAPWGAHYSEIHYNSEV